jgi:hypothetical protein
VRSSCRYRYGCRLKLNEGQDGSAGMEMTFQGDFTVG